MLQIFVVFSECLNFNTKAGNFYLMRTNVLSYDSLPVLKKFQTSMDFLTNHNTVLKFELVSSSVNG